MLESPPAVEFPAFVDSSMLNAYKGCPRKFYYKYLRHLAETERSVHLVAGGAFAAALEEARMCYWKDGQPKDEAIYQATHTLIRHYGDFPPPDNSYKTCENMILALLDYFSHYGWKEDHIQPFWPEGSDKPAVEFSFAIPLPINHPETGEPLLYTGRFDMIGEHYGSLYAVDEKTASRLGPAWSKQWTLRSQFMGYCWAAQQFGYPVAGAIVRGVCILSKDINHAEVILQFPPHKISAWYENMLYYTQRMVDDWREGIWHQVFDGACSEYSGCPFMLLCDKTNPESWVSTNYKLREWNPLEDVG